METFRHLYLISCGEAYDASPQREEAKQIRSDGELSCKVKKERVMAIRNIRELGEECLRKVCKPVKDVNLRTKILIGDMFDTMYEANGVGLAAPQVGILKRIFVIDCGDEEGNSVPYVFINPEIIDRDGSQTDYEGCLSVPGKSGLVTRANWVKVRAFNEKMEAFEMEAEGLLARCILHENDHLDGVVYVDKVEGKLYNNEELYGEEKQ